jgi:hypothetical protein
MANNVRECRIETILDRVLEKDRASARTRHKLLYREKGIDVRKITHLSLAVFVLAIAALIAQARPVGATLTATCNGLTPTITGSGAIIGTDGDDVIVGSAGDDSIIGGGGNDTICGEGGNDRIVGGAGNDQMWGEVARNDVLIGSAGNDFIVGGDGSDLLVDTVGSGQVLDAGSGNDTLLGIGVLNGGTDDDTIRSVAPGPSTLIGGPGTDGCTSGTQTDRLVACEA